MRDIGTYIVLLVMIIIFALRNHCTVIRDVRLIRCCWEHMLLLQMMLLMGMVLLFQTVLIANIK